MNSALYRFIEALFFSNRFSRFTPVEINRTAKRAGIASSNVLVRREIGRLRSRGLVRPSADGLYPGWFEWNPEEERHHCESRREEGQQR